MPVINHWNLPAKKENILCQDGADQWSKGSSVHKSGLHNCQRGSNPGTGPEGRARLSPASRRSFEQVGP